MPLITEKKLRNKRFYQTEVTIITAYIATRELLSVSRLVRSAGISRSTLYRHHKTIYAIVPDYEAYALRSYRRHINRLLKIKGIHISHLYESTLMFMTRYRKVLQLLTDYSDKDITKLMLCHLQPKILASGKITNQQMFELYISQASTLINQWQRDGYKREEISPIIDKLNYLTNTARKHLAPIVKSPH